MQALAALVLAAPMSFIGCGVQGVPHAPNYERPEAVADLAALQVGQSVDLHFTLPRHTTEGRRLTKPLELDVLRSVLPAGAAMTQLPPLELWTNLTPTKWLPSAQGNNVDYTVNLTEREFQDWRGHTLVVAVSTLTRGFRRRALESEPSNLVDVPIIDVSKPVSSVHCLVTEKAIDVQFTPPATTLSGGTVHHLTGYRIYRSATGKPGSFDLQGETPAPPYRDSQFSFGRSYYYEVRAVFGPPGRTAMSAASAATEVTPRDLFPPAPPEGLTALYAAGAVELVWNANSEPDLAGYNVYRVEDHTPVRVNNELLRTPIFRDASAPPGKTLTYYVTAVDQSGNESRESQPAIVETT